MSDLTVPNHIGFIIDGNRRWAKKHGLPTYEGHMAGYNTVMEVLTAAIDAGVKYASVYAFSTENWKRGQEEVNKIMALVSKVLTSDLPILIKKNVKLLIVGSLDGVSDKIQAEIKDAVAKTAHNTAGTLAICFNYGGQQEIVDAIKKIVKAGIPADKIDIDLVSQNIYAPEIPPVDLIVRTSGEQRLSNFMLWRSTYSEIMFIKKLWPEMQKKDVGMILREYSKRARRFGS